MKYIYLIIFFQCQDEMCKQIAFRFWYIYRNTFWGFDSFCFKRKMQKIIFQTRSKFISNRNKNLSLVYAVLLLVITARIDILLVQIPEAEVFLFIVYVVAITVFFLFDITMFIIKTEKRNIV